MSAQQVDLLNTPGIYYAAAYWISSMIFLCVRKDRKTGRSVIIRQIGVLLFLCVFMLAGYKRIPMLLFPLSVLLEFYMIALNLRLGSDMPELELWYTAARAFIVGELAAAFHWQLFYYALTSLGMPLRLWVNFLFQVPTWLLVFGLTWFLEHRAAEGGLRPDLTPRLVLMLIFIIAVTYIISNISYVLQGTPFTAAGSQELFIVRTLADLAGCGTGYVFHLAVCEMGARMEAEKMRQILEMQYENYRISRDSMDLVNRKYHDLKHQIAFLKSGITEDERLSYLEQMEEEVRIFETQNRTGNDVLDAILSSKTLRCQEKGIELHTVADGSALSFMNKMDISALFGNILDNAIEAAEGLPVGERLIRLTVTRQQGFLRITEENRLAEHLVLRDGLPVTTKREEEGYHGFGIRSIRAVAESYGGTASVGTEHQMFLLRILIPIP